MRPTFRQMSIICMVVVFLLPFAAGAQENSSQPAEDDWPMVNYDIVMSRNSPQTAITRDNVDQLADEMDLQLDVHHRESAADRERYCIYREQRDAGIRARYGDGPSRWQYDMNVTR